MRRPRRGLGSREPSRVADVRRDRQHAGVAAADHFHVDHHVADPDIGEQPPVPIASLPIELELDAPATEQRLVESRRGLAARLAAHAVVRDLRRVDADVADALAAAVDPDVDRVAVVDVNDGRLLGQWRSAPRERRRGGDEDHRKDERGSHAASVAPLKATVNVREWRQALSPSIGHCPDGVSWSARRAASVGRPRSLAALRADQPFEPLATRGGRSRRPALEHAEVGREHALDLQQ